MHHFILFSALLIIALPAPAQTGPLPYQETTKLLHGVPHADFMMTQSQGANDETRQQILNREITRIDKNLKATEQLLEKHKNALRDLERNAMELTQIKEAIPEKMYRQISGDNAELMASTQEEIDRIQTLARKFQEEKKRLQDELERITGLSLIGQFGQLPLPVFYT